MFKDKHSRAAPNGISLERAVNVLECGMNPSGILGMPRVDYLSTGFQYLLRAINLPLWTEVRLKKCSLCLIF